MSLPDDLGATTSSSCGITSLTPNPAIPPDSAVPLTAPDRRKILRKLHAMRRQNHDSQSTPSACDPQIFTPPRPPDPLQQIEDNTGLRLPGDATAVLGDSLLASYGGLSLGGLPKVALRTHPGDLASAQAVVGKGPNHVGSSTGVPLSIDTSGDDLILATSSEYAHEVEQAGTLGEQAQAKLALGDPPAAVSSAGYVDLSKILPLLGFVPRDAQALKAIGFWAAADNGVELSQLRVVVG